MAEHGKHFDRVARIRRMLEQNLQDPELFSADLVSHASWDLANKRESKGSENSFNPNNALEGAHVTVEQAFENGDEVTVRWRLRGKWSRPFAGIEPTGRQIDITGINIYRFKGNKIVEKRGELDWATLGRQTFGGLNAAACQRALVAVSLPGETTGQQ
jgi:hypothetical protein